MNDDVSLSDQFDNLTKRHGDWQQYKLNYFMQLDQKQRTNELAIFDRALHEEAKPTKEFSSYWSRRRELEDLDALMRKANR